jgi:hypothetical protein
MMAPDFGFKDSVFLPYIGIAEKANEEKFW